MNNGTDRDLTWLSYSRHLRLKSRTPRTIETYHYTYRHFQEWLGKAPIEASRLEVSAYIEHLLSHYKPSTVAKAVRDLRAFYNWAVEEELIAASPMARIKPPQYEYGDKRVFTEKELKKFLSVTKGTSFQDRRDHAMIRLLCEIGSPRLGEIIGMTMDSVDFYSDLITVSGKTGERSIPVGIKTMRAFELYLRTRENHPRNTLSAFWLGRNGALGKDGISWMLKKRAREAGITGTVHPHLFRHTAASRASAAGVQDSLMEPLFGWTNNSVMTRLYGRSTKISRAHSAARKAALGDLL